MYKIWKKKSQKEINNIVFDALNKNVNYSDENVLGVPASYLDSRVFSQDESYLRDAPYLSTLIQNPNHIGCHTLGKSERYFAGTHEIEKELISICSRDILKSNEDIDGYVASGGTEANIQAIWIYRNYYKREFNASLDEIVILCSEDSHYSMDKASNLLEIDLAKVKVDTFNRNLDEMHLNDLIGSLKEEGKKYFIVINNMMTTMFGSIDDIDVYVNALKKNLCEYKIHIDGAFGGFYYPFVDKESVLTFENEEISSFTLDAHKMAQAPYGTGLFLVRKNLMKYAGTKAEYVEGNDFTLIGSRSGANAIATWMILAKNGPFGWQEKIFILQKRTEWMCENLKELGINFYSHISSNIITIRANCIKADIANRYGLVPDNHNDPSWYKIVIMDHVTIEKLKPLMDELVASKPICVK